MWLQVLYVLQVCGWYVVSVWLVCGLAEFNKMVDHCPVVALAFEEMRTPYASGQETCVQNLEKVYQQKEIEKRMKHFKSILPPGSEWFSEIMFLANDAQFPFTITWVPLISGCSCHVLVETCRGRVLFFCVYTVRNTSMILRNIQ